MLIEGKNCWRVVDAARAAFLIDADAYFSAFRQAVSRARHRVIMVGWDIDSRVRLGRPAQAQTAPDAPPATLLSFLNDTLAQRPELRVYALPWDFSVIFTLERELLPSFRFAWKAHPRLSFQLDDAFPFSGAHHQKIVVDRRDARLRGRRGSGHSPLGHTRPPRRRCATASIRTGGPIRPSTTYR